MRSAAPPPPRPSPAPPPPTWGGDEDRRCNVQNDVARSHTPPRSRGVKTPELCQQPPSRREGAGNAGCALHPQSRVQKVKSTRGSHHRFTGAARHSPRNGFNGFLRDLPGDRALLSPSSCEYGWSAPGRADFASAKLDASVEASRPHDFAVRSTVVRLRAA